MTLGFCLFLATEAVKRCLECSLDFYSVPMGNIISLMKKMDMGKINVHSLGAVLTLGVSRYVGNPWNVSDTVASAKVNKRHGPCSHTAHTLLGK